MGDSVDFHRRRSFSSRGVSIPAVAVKRRPISEALLSALAAASEHPRKSRWQIGSEIAKQILDVRRIAPERLTKRAASGLAIAHAQGRQPLMGELVAREPVDADIGREVIDERSEVELIARRFIQRLALGAGL